MPQKVFQMDTLIWLDMVAHSFSPGTQEAEGGELEASLISKVSFRTAMAITQRNSALENQK